MNNCLFQGTADKAPLTAKEAAVYTGFSVSTLRLWRQQGKKPKFTMFQRRAYYQKNDLDEFLSHCFDKGRTNLNNNEQ